MKKTRKRASHFDTCVRWWGRLNGRVIRFLQVSRYDKFGNIREYVRQIASNDPRPRGVHMHGLTESSLKQYATLPQGVWCEMVYQ